MLCTLGEKTCGACCFGPSVSQESLAQKLRRHRRAFEAHHAGGRPPDGFALLRHELQVRSGADVFWALVLKLPIAGRWFRARLERRIVCAFLAFLDGTERGIGCLLHPTRWDGRDVRSASAFRLLDGFFCGSAEYFCPAALRFESASSEEHRRFRHESREMDWYAYSLAASSYGEAGRERSPPCRSSSTKPSI